MSREPDSIFNGIKKLRQRKDAKATPSRVEGAGAKVGGYSKSHARREQILTGLMSALDSGELRNPSLKAIGKTLGLEPAHILYYYSTREELLQAVIRRWDADNTVQTDEKGDKTVPSLDSFVEAVQANLVHPGVVHLYLTIAAEAVNPEHPAHDFVTTRFKRVKASLAGAIKCEQARGLVDPSIDPEIEARLLIALADGLQLQSLIDPNVDAVRHIQSAIARIRS